MSEEALKIVVNIIATVSVLSSLAILITMYLFRELRSKFFMQIIAFISISDLLGNICYAIPYRAKEHKVWCYMEGLINVTSYPISWLWTLALVYLLYYLAIYNSFPSLQLIRIISGLCWGVPIGLTLISLGFVHYGEHTDESGSYEVCVFRKDEATFIYHSITYYGLLILCFLWMWYLSWKLSKLEATSTSNLSESSSSAASTAPNVSATSLYSLAKASLRLYPYSMILCWLPRCLLFITSGAYDNAVQVYGVFFFITETLKISHGTLTTIIFFYKSPESRRLWCKYLGFSTTQQSDVERMSSMDIDSGLTPRFSNLYIGSDRIVENMLHTEREMRGDSRIM